MQIMNGSSEGSRVCKEEKVRGFGGQSQSQQSQIPMQCSAVRAGLAPACAFDRACALCFLDVIMLGAGGGRGLRLGTETWGTGKSGWPLRRCLRIESLLDADRPRWPRWVGIGAWRGDGRGEEGA